MRGAHWSRRAFEPGGFSAHAAPDKAVQFRVTSLRCLFL